MKKMYFFVLSIITAVYVLGLALLEVNGAVDGALFTIPAEYVNYVELAKSYGALILLCMFAFASLAGKVVRIILIILIVIAIIAFVVATFAPDWLKEIFALITP